MYTSDQEKLSLLPKMDLELLRDQINLELQETVPQIKFGLGIN